MANIPKVWNGSQFIELEAAATVAPGASTSVAGIVQLSDSTSTTSSVLAATPTAVKSAYDLAAAAVPKSTVTTAGDVIYATGSAAVTRLALGTAGKVLTVNAGATAPEWATAASGGMTLISTATPSAASTISFTSIPSTYKHLVLIWKNMYQSALANTWSVTLNNDTNTRYDWGVVAKSTTTGVVSVQGQATTNIGGTGKNSAVLSYGNNAATPEDQLMSGIMNIYRYTDTDVRVYNWQSFTYSPSDSYNILANGSGRYRGTSAVTSIEFVRGGSQTITGTVYLYGVS